MGLWPHPEVPLGAAACPHPSLGNLVLGPHRGCLRDSRGPYADTRLHLYVSLLPCAIGVVLGLFRLWHLWKKPLVTRWSNWATLKIILWCLLAAIDLSISVLSIIRGAWNTAEVVIVAATAALTFSFNTVFIFLSKTEHSKSRAPSAILQSLLLFTIIFDAFRVGNLWLDRYHGSLAIASLLTAHLAVKLILLMTESATKSVYLTIPATQQSKEELSGIFGRGLCLWINPLLRLGWKKDLTLDDLEPVDDALSGERVLEKLSAAWDESDQTKDHALAVAVVKAFAPELFFIHFPRLAKVGFALAQPILVRVTIEYVQDGNKRPVEDGYRLIAAFALVYTGVAISTYLSGQLAYRLITRIRGSLIAVIYQHMLALRPEAANSQAAVALMSTEVERITVAAEWSVAIVPNLIQVVLALWILGNQLGAVCVAPVLIAVLSVSGAIKLGRLIPPRQRRWMQAIQRRVGITTEIIRSIRGVKASGLSGTARDQIQGLRDFELEESKRFRRVQISNVLVGQFPSIMTPAITLAAFAVTQHLADGRPLDVVRAFTSLSLLGILINPVSELVMIPNNLGSSIGCLDRIQEFLVKEKRHDYRDVKRAQTQDPNATVHPPTNPEPLIKVSNGSFGWTATHPILHSITLEIHHSTLTILTGPVGSGKSTLLKALVGETRRVAGVVEYRTAPEVAYCDQDPWILNQSIRENIVGGAEFVSELYERVVRACQLEEDFGLMPRGDETVVGSSGAALSGGQKHRIALARAVYSGKQIVIMDDNLKGLDSRTASRCFDALFGSSGLLREQKRSVIFATHNGANLPLLPPTAAFLTFVPPAQWLPSADQIISLNAEGRVSERGTYDELLKAGGYVSKLRVAQQNLPETDAPSQKERDTNEHVSTKSKPVVSDEVKAKKRGAANTGSLLYYIRSMGARPFLLFAGMVVFHMGCRTMQRLWVKFWVAANEDGGEPRLGLWVGVYVLWGVLTEVSLAIETYYFLVVIVPHSAKGLHFGVLKAALAAPMSFFVKTDTGVIINRFSQDMNLIDLPLPLAFMLTFDYIFLATAELTLTCLATGYLALAIPPLALLLHLIQRVYLQTSRQIRLLDLEAKSPIFSHFLSTSSGLVTIRALAYTRSAQAENLARLDASQKAFYAMGSLQKWLLLVLELTVAGLAVLLVSSAVALREDIDPGLLGVALVSVMGFGQLLTLLLKYWADLETSLGAVARIREFETETPAETSGDGEGPQGGWFSQGGIRVSDVSAAYDDHQVLRDVNLDIRPGEKVAVCGRTGSGKSTLLSLLLRLHEPSAGTIEVDGVDISAVPVDALREALVALPQDPLFLPGTVRRNLDPLSVRDDAAISGALEKTGLWGLIEDKGGLGVELETEWLSAGQKQLFCVARAMLRRSRVLLLDEATSSLDQATEQTVQDLIRTSFEGWTVIVIAHRLRAVVDFDKVVTLQDGRVVEFDHPRTLMERGGVFASLLKLQEG
ncbi:ABC multidrug transporter [Colletotrichum karsti]|uniref:ABC multidrug transporter n=1 Tax=Colletotrichum karsti TaxID=1095194 RepID=A0A9P6LKH8_9PEZI|nr:ABC multidrug transporter [Colletotrichum karsti]KAF9876778.1 ABC multidrug transporter [Colletotrichum karsti]